jgi:fido (protein-threonine AMPylation protein)
MVQQSSSAELQSLGMVWRERRSGLAASGALEHTLSRLQREWAVETGLIDRLYSWERGVTEALMEYGVNASTIELQGGAHRGTGERVSQLIHDQFGVVAGLMDFVKGQKPLTQSYIRSLHSLFTRHQDAAELLLESNRVERIVIRKGEYRTVQDYTRVQKETVRQHCPPDDISSEMTEVMEQYQEWHRAAPPEVLAAWIHHAIVTVRPFEDANGRVARALATLVFLQAGLFPLIVRLSDRDEYLRAIKAADAGSLQPLVAFFAQRQRDTILEGLGAPRAQQTKVAADSILNAAVEALQKRKNQHEVRLQEVFGVAEKLHELAKVQWTELAKRISDQIQPLSIADEPYHADCKACSPEQRASHYYFRELIRTARILNYYANTQPHRAWVRIAIETDEIFYIVLSFHAIGQQFEGVLGANAFTFQRMHNEEGGRDIANLKAACDTVFQFNYLEEPMNVQDRFTTWLTRCVAQALDQWKLTLGS